jgi:hypothetical protein
MLRNPTAVEGLKCARETMLRNSAGVYDRKGLEVTDFSVGVHR